MSTGRFVQRGWAFQSWAFRPWGLAGGVDGVVVSPPVYTQIGTLHGPSRKIGSISGASKAIGKINGQTRKIGTISGLDD